MILPIVAYGHPVLREVAKDVSLEDPALPKLIEDMWATMYASNGVGLAAPQIGKAIRLFVIDSVQIHEGMDEEDKAERHHPDAPGYKGVFINAQVTALDGTPWKYNEGCLSIPKIREDVSRAETVTVQYLDEEGQSHTRSFSGITGRVVLHEYDHIEGKLFIDHLPPLRRKLMKRKLDDISRGAVRTDYKMAFPKTR